MAIPFKTLRYQLDDMQTLGFQVVRVNRWKNEISFLAPSDPALGSSGFMLVSSFATVVGIEVPPPAMNLDVKPYIVSDLDDRPRGVAAALQRDRCRSRPRT